MNSDEAIPRGLRLLLGAAAAVVVLAGVRAIDFIVAPVFLALVLTVLVHPVSQWLRGKGLPGWASTTAMLVLVYVLILGLTVSLVVSIGRFAAILPQYQDTWTELLANGARTLDRLGVDADQLRAFRDDLDLSKIGDVVLGLVGGLVDILTNVVFICAAALMMTFDAGKFPANLAAVAREHPGIGAAFSSFAHGTRTSLLVSTVFGFLVAVLDTIALAFMGIPVPVLWGLLSFITNYIPNIGFVIGLIPPAILGLLEGGPGLMIAVIVVYSVINIVLQSVIQPKFVGDAVGLATTVTFVSLIFWTFVMGPLGALLAIPLTLFAKAVLVDVDPRIAWVDTLASNRDSRQEEAVPAPPVQEVRTATPTP